MSTTSPTAAGRPSASPPPSAQRASWGLSYQAKLIAGVCGLVLLTGTTVTWLAHRSARASTEALCNALFREVSSDAVSNTRNFVKPAGTLVDALRQLSDRGLALDDSDRLAKQLLAFLDANPGLSWVSYGDEAGAFTGVYRTAGGLRVNQSRIAQGHTRLVEHDVLPDGSWRVAVTNDDSGYDPRTRPWYRKAREEGRVVWLPPYVFYNQGVPGISCAAPVSDSAGRLRGAFSVDFDLNALSDFVARLKVSEHSRVFLFTPDGSLLAYPDLRVTAAADGGEAGRLPTLADAGDPRVDAYRAHLRPEYVHPDTEEAFHPFDFESSGTEYLASATAFHVGGDQVWVVGVVAPKDDFLSGVWRSQGVALFVAAAALLAAVLLAFALAHSVARPVEALIGLMRRVGGGDLEARADLGGSREFRELSDALNRMLADVRDRLRLRHSLDVAMEVQQRLLPRSPPRVPGLDVAGHSTYCDETGGDYYDFLILDEPAPGSLLVALGDVMGHGVAAALVMAGARAVLRDRADSAGGLAALLGRLNRLLAADLEGTRFMTMHLSLSNAQAATFRWVSAGHDPALIFDPAAGNFEEIDEGGIPLGVMEGVAYEEYCYRPLRPGQVITVGTDGVWEMPNESGDQFGKDRLREVIRGAAAGTAAEIVQAILDNLTKFRGACRQVDDVTFVVIKVTGPEATGGWSSAAPVVS